jgi:hypothetical protein
LAQLQAEASDDTPGAARGRQAKRPKAGNRLAKDPKDKDDSG